MRRLLFIALGCALLAPPALAERWKRVRGRDGQVDLLLDRQRSLDAFGHARLEARHRSPAKTLRNLLRLVRTRIRPSLIMAPQPYLLSDRIRIGLGDCRDQVFALQLLAEDAGLPVEVRYGDLYQNGQLLSGHAWAEKRLGRRRFLLDPALSSELLLPRRVSVEVTVLGGSVHDTPGWEVGEYLYAETDDLLIE